MKRLKLISLGALLVVGSGIVGGCGSAAEQTETETTNTTDSSLTALSTSGCIPINQTISFSGSGLQINTENDIYGGSIPNVSTTYGSITVGTTNSVSGTTFSSVSDGSTYSVGTFQITVEGATGSYFYGTKAATGSIGIGSYYQQWIQNYVNTSGYFSSTSTSTPCVSGLGIQGHLYTTSGYGFGGHVFLYLNNTQHGVTIFYQ